VTAAVLIAIAVSLLFAATAPNLGQRLPPALATRVLVSGSVAVTASTMFVLAVVAFTWLGQLPGIAALGSWSAATLQHDDPIPGPAAIGSALLLPLLGAQAATTIVRRCRALLGVQRSCRHLPNTSSLVVVDAERADAFTTPQRRGRIVVTTGLLRALDPAERRVVLAHETSHLEHRHPWWVLAAELAAAANPMLSPTARAVAHTVERWADEDAAGAVADRTLTARTLARTALLMHRGPTVVPGAALGLMNADVPGRVQALLSPPSRRRPGAVAALATLALASMLAAIAVQHLGERLFEHAAAESRVTVSTAVRPALDDSGSRLLPHVTGALVAERV
jgi:Zn-dependent protease with chaperone function